jgi:hypothetical protein
MQATYRFDILPPDKRLAVAIHQSDSDARCSMRPSWPNGFLSATRTSCLCWPATL